MYPLYKWGWKVLAALVTYVTATEIYVFTVSLKNNFKASEFLMSAEEFSYLKKLFYYPTHIRCGAWVSGIVLGYYFYKKRHTKIVINEVSGKLE